MITILLCIIFSCDLNFNHLTLQTLFAWFCNHPFLFIIALGECTGKWNLVSIENIIRR